MLLESEVLKQMIEKQKIHKHDDVVERCFNQGLDTAWKLIRILEEAEKQRERIHATN